MKHPAQGAEKSNPAKWLIVAGILLAGGAGWFALSRKAEHGEIKNVVLISIDTCRPDRLSCYGYRRPTTPHIDALAKDGLLFKRAMSPVPLTTPSHASMLTGTYPPTHGIRLNNGDRLAESNITLAETLREAGFQTGAFVGAFPLDSSLGLNQGFDTYDSNLGAGSAAAGEHPERPAEDVNRPALAWLEKSAGKPFFLFLHYYDAHAPYQPPMPFAATFSDDAYAAEIAHVDHCIGQVLDRLRALGVYKNTLVIVTADHGEGLGEHGEGGHALLTYQSTLHVPLIIRSPVAPLGREVEGNVSLVDIMPTVLDLVGAKMPERIQGLSLRACLDGAPVPIRAQPIYFESLEAETFGCTPLNGVVEGSWKYIRAPRQELYDLDVDADEKNNLFEKEVVVAPKLRGRLETFLQQLLALAPQSGRSTIDREAQKRLESLGYVNGGKVPGSAPFDSTLEDPKDFLAAYQDLQTANFLMRSNRAAEAKSSMLKLVANRPRLVPAHALLGMIAAGERRFDEAVQRCAAIVSILKESKEPLESLAEGAEPTVGKLDTRDLSAAHVNLALMYLELGKHAEAIAQYEEALRLRPDFAEAHFNVGVLLSQTGKPAQAIGHYEQAVRTKPNHARAHLNWANALMQTSRSKEAFEHYEQALRIQPDFLEAHYYLGMALQAGGRSAEAVTQFEHVLRIRPDFGKSDPRFGPALNEARRAAGIAPR